MPVKTPGEQLLEGYDTANVERELQDLPAQILRDKMAEAEKRKVVKEINVRLSLRATELQTAVNQARDDHGKPLHGNKEAREIALQQAKATDDIYLRIQDEMSVAREVVEQAQHQLQFSETRFNAMRSLSYLLAAKLELLASK